MSADLPTSAADVRALDRELAKRSAPDRLSLAVDTFGLGILTTSSFGVQSAVLLHLLSRAHPSPRVVFVDTGFHFPETLAYARTLATLLGLTVETATAARSELVALGLSGPTPWTTPDPCCHARKVTPLEPWLASASAWLSGVRRAQSPTRAATPFAHTDDRGIVKIAPLADFSDADVEAYFERHGLPRHPLEARGYRSIGCEPCTRPVAGDDDPRAGRWAGSEKTECGLHGPGYAPRSR